MTEYRDAAGNVKVTNPPNSSQQNYAGDTALVVELKKAKEREKKLEAALHEVFPLDLYIQLRPDVKEAYRGNAKMTIEHFIKTGINEINIQEEYRKNKLELYEHVKEAASALAIKLDRTRSALFRIFPFHRYAHARPDVEASCDGKPKEMIEHFIEYGIHEVDLKHKFLSLKTTETCLKNLNSLNSLGQITNSRVLTLLKTKGNPTNLQGNQEHDFAIKHTSVHYQSNTVCTWIPKNGCSNLRYSIAKENGAISKIDEIEWIHRNNDCFNANIKDALHADYAFVILRNPFKRLLSFFLDKLCHPQQDQPEESYKHAFKVFDFTGESTFMDFVNYIWEHPDSIDSDEHTKPQCDFLLYRKYDSYFALENIKDAIEKINEKTGIVIEDVRDKNSIFTSKGREHCPEITNTTKALQIKSFLDQNMVPIVENMYTGDMIKKVASLYLQDILLYCNEIHGGCVELDYWINRAITED